MHKAKILILYIIFHCFALFSWEKEGIYEASYCGQIEEIKKYIQNGVDLNIKDEGGDLPLTLAAIYNQYEAVKLLIENGADVNKKAAYGRTALMLADSMPVIKLLIKKGADIYLEDSSGDNALLLASEKCNIKKAELLLSLGCDINNANKYGQTPLMKVILNPFTKERTKLDFIKILLDKKADVNLRDKEDKTVYIISKERSLNNISKLLLEFGAKEEIYSLDPASLVQALMNIEYDRAKVLIKNGVKVNYLSGDFSPLMCSIENVEIMKLLLEKGADVNLKNKMNMTALTIAVMSNKVDAVKLLLENKADVNVVSTLNDQTPLMFALQNKNQAIIKMLKDKVADINAKDSYGNTTLLQAITIHSVNMEEIKYLIANTNQINEFNDLGMSPLFKAVGLGHIELVRYLLQNGADINQKNYKGVDVLTVARKTKNNPEMIKLLQELGAK